MQDQESLLIVILRSRADGCGAGGRKMDCGGEGPPADRFSRSRQPRLLVPLLREARDPVPEVQDTYPLGWVRRGDPGTLSCPRCGSDLTAMAAAHAQACHYRVNHLTPQDLPARAANL
jgi:hypothetical protein